MNMYMIQMSLSYQVAMVLYFQFLSVVSSSNKYVKLWEFLSTIFKEISYFFKSGQFQVEIWTPPLDF